MNEKLLGGKEQFKLTNADIANATDVICPYCEKFKKEDEPSANVFFQAFIMKRISALQSSTGEEMFIPVPIFICQNCGNQLVPGQ